MDLIGPASVLALSVAIVAAFVLVVDRISIERHATALAAAAIAFPIFYVFRTNVLNPDGNGFTPKFERDVPLVGAHVTHDEMLELFVHSRFWDYTHRWWGWSVVHSYQVVSCAAGVLFVYAVFRLARRLAPEAPAIFMAGVFTGGYMQLFFGDVENYTVTTAIVALYLLAACRFIAREVPLWVPALVLALAACFHLEAAWLGLSLLYLCHVSRQRTGGVQEVTTSLASATGLVLATVLYLHVHGLPVRRFFSSHAGHAVRMNGVFAFGEPAGYYRDQIELLLLLCPAILVSIPLLAWRRRNLTEEDCFLAWGAASMLVFQAIWRAQLGVFNDWNLYAIGAFVVSLTLWRAIVSAARSSALRLGALALTAACGWHTYTWIAANHAAGR